MHIVGFALGFAFLTGCAHRLQLRAVDASSGKAVPAASVQVEERETFSYFYRQRHIHEVGSTDKNGAIVVSGMDSRHLIYLEAVGYRPAMASLDGGNRRLIDWYPSHMAAWSGSPPRGPWTPSGFVATNTGKIITVPLAPSREVP